MQDGGGEQADDQRGQAGPPSRRKTSQTSSVERPAAARSVAPVWRPPALRPGCRSAGTGPGHRSPGSFAVSGPAPGARCAPRRSASAARAAATTAASRSRSARRWARSLLMRRAHRVRDPVAQQRGAGVAGLLRVELGGGQRAVLDRGDEPVAAVLGPGHQRGAGAVVGDQRPVAHAVGVHEVEPLGLDPGEEAASRPGPRRCSSPCAGTTGAWSRSTTPGHSSQPSVSTPCSTPRLEEHLHADADAEHRPAAGEPAADDPRAVDRAQARPCRRRTRRRRAPPGRRRPARRRGRRSASTSAPARSTARTAERRLPEP